MSSALRNRLALIIFFLLMAFGGLCIVVYIVVGHGWNYAATEIDDTSGNMQEYLVVVFDGTSPKERKASAAQGKNKNSANQNNQNTSNSSNSNSSNNSNNTNNQNTIQQGIGEQIQRFFDLDTSSDATQDEREEIDNNPIMTNDVSSQATLGDVLASYNEKGADVLSLYSRDVSHYSSGNIYYKGSYTVGVLGLSEIESYKQVQAKIDDLRTRGANVVVVLTSRSSMLAATSGVNVCIEVGGSTQTVESFVDHGMLTVKTSVVGTIDAVILSPNHIVSAKML